MELVERNVADLMAATPTEVYYIELLEDSLR